MYTPGQNSFAIPFPAPAVPRLERGRGTLARSLRVVTLLAVIQPSASVQALQDRPVPASPWDRLVRTVEEIQKFGPWEEQFAWIDRSMIRLWDQNGWNTESDRFALDTLRDVARIPPWQINERLDRFGQAIKSRYDLSDAQVAGVRRSMTGEMTGLFIKHAPTIVSQIQQQLDLRIEAPDDESFMREIQKNVAGWVHATEPLHRDALAALERMSAAFEAGLSAEQKARFEKDRESLKRLTDYTDKVRGQAAEGHFRPEDFGLTTDEFLRFARMTRGQSAAATPANGEAGSDASGRRVEAVRLRKHDPSTWHVHVREFERKFQLEPGQIKAAESILVELVERAERYILAHQSELDKVEPGDRENHEAFEPVVQLFGELDSRIGAIPRREQRDAAGKPRSQDK